MYALASYAAFDSAAGAQGAFYGSMHPTGESSQLTRIDGGLFYGWVLQHLCVQCLVLIEGLRKINCFLNTSAYL